MRYQGMPRVSCRSSSASSHAPASADASRQAVGTHRSEARLPAIATEPRNRADNVASRRSSAVAENVTGRLAREIGRMQRGVSSSPVCLRRIREERSA